MIHIRIVQGIKICGGRVNVLVSLHRVLVRGRFYTWDVRWHLLLSLDYDGYSCMRQWDAFIGWNAVEEKKVFLIKEKKKNCSWYLYILFFKPVHSKKRQSLLLDLSFTLIMNSLLCFFDICLCTTDKCIVTVSWCS